MEARESQDAATGSRSREDELGVQRGDVHGEGYLKPAAFRVKTVTTRPREASDNTVKTLCSRLVIPRWR